MKLMMILLCLCLECTIFSGMFQNLQLHPFFLLSVFPWVIAILALILLPGNGIDHWWYGKSPRKQFLLGRLPVLRTQKVIHVATLSFVILLGIIAFKNGQLWSPPPICITYCKKILYVPWKKKMVDTSEMQNLFWDPLIKASLFQTYSSS